MPDLGVVQYFLSQQAGAKGLAEHKCNHAGQTPEPMNATYRTLFRVHLMLDVLIGPL